MTLSLPVPDSDPVNNVAAQFVSFRCHFFPYLGYPYPKRDIAHSCTYTDSGWPDGIAWLLGLLQAGLGLTGFDAVAHMIGMHYRPRNLPTLLTNMPEEIPNPQVEGPRIMIATVLIGITTGFLFLVSIPFSKMPFFQLSTGGTSNSETCLEPMWVRSSSH